MTIESAKHLLKIQELRTKSNEAERNLAGRKMHADKELHMRVGLTGPTGQRVWQGWRIQIFLYMEENANKNSHSICFKPLVFFESLVIVHDLITSEQVDYVNKGRTILGHGFIVPIWYCTSNRRRRRRNHSDSSIFV